MVEAIATLLVSIVVLATLADRLGAPRPVVLLLGGVVLGLVPGVPVITFDGTAVFAVLFPVLLFAGAYASSWNDLRPNAATVLPLAAGGIIGTTVAVGVVAHTVIGMPWAVALLLGAVLADPDLGVFSHLVARLRSVGATIARPVRVVLSGEGLIEGATGLVLYLALAAAVTAGSFSVRGVLVALVIGPLLGAVGGLAVAYAWSEADRRLSDPTISVAFSLLAPFAAYLPTAAIGGNRIAAVVSAGLFLGWRSHSVLEPAVRTGAASAWAVLSFVVSGAVYVPAGMALPEVLSALLGARAVVGAPEVLTPTPGRLLVWTLALVLAVWAARAVVAFGVFALRRGWPRLRRRPRRGVVLDACWQYAAVGAWAPTRGAFALASALALPFTVDSGDPFPARDLVVALSLTVVLVTTVVQGATLPALLRALHLPPEERDTREENLAWRVGAEEALARLAELEGDGELPEGLGEALHRQYSERVRRYTELGPDPARGPGRGAAGPVGPAAPDVALRRELLAVERQALRQLRADDVISDSVFRSVLHEMDLLEQYLRY